MRNKGYIYAPNSFDLQQLHEIMIKEKGKYLL
jgi:hypothetical protein